MRKPGNGFSGRVTPLFHNMLVPPLVVGEGLEQPPEPQPTPSTAPLEVLSPLTTAATSQPPKDPSTYRRTKRGRNIKVPQSGGSPNKVGDEAINEEMLDSVERAATTATSLEAEQASGNINKTQFMTTLNEPFSLELGSGSGPWRQETMGGMQAQTRSEGVSNLSSDPPLLGGHTLRSGEDSNEHQIELTDNVLDLEKKKDDQVVEILKLKKIVKKLERRRKSSISHLRRRIYRQVESSDDDLDEEDASKQGKTSDKIKPMFKDSDFDDLDDLVDEGMTFVQDKDVENQGKIGADDTEVVTQKQTPPTTTTVFDDEDVTMAMAQTFIKMKEEKAKEKGVAIKDETEPVEKTKKKVQGDAEVALRLQAELDEKLRARIDVDYELAARMTQEEQEKYTIKERARTWVVTNTKEAQKPDKRLKRVAGSYATQKSPKKLKVMKYVKDVIEEEAAEYEKEKEKLRLSLKIIFNDDSEVNYEPLSRKFPIVNWEYQLLGKMEAKDMYIYKLIRADGSSSYHGDTQAFLRRLDRQDLNDLYRLVQERFQDHPLEGHDLLLWGDLRMIFDPDEKDELWMNQLD
ncbi:hypothetical protein Tco_1097474 [Tanacetum coccineum]